jgi:hypothetical protein
MKTIIFLVLLLQTISAQKDSLLQYYLNRSASGLKNPVQNTEKFFSSFFPDLSNNEPAAYSSDTLSLFYFEITFSSPPEYNLHGKMIPLNFNYIIEDSFCNSSNRNGVLLLEKSKTTPAVKKQPEKLEREVFVLVPDKCTTTRFYNSAGEMFCDNKRNFEMEYDKGKEVEKSLKVRVGMQLLSSSRGDFYERIIPAEENYPVERTTKEYVLRCCIRSITFLKGDEVLDNFVSIKYSTEYEVRRRSTKVS